MSAENVTKEKYEYLFLDIEWNQEPGTTDIDGREPVQIAIVAADEELQKVKTFSKSVRLDDPTVLAKNTIKISHVSLQDVTNGKTKEDVMKRIKLSFPTFNNIVVWKKDTYDLFQREMKQSGIKLKKHNVIVMQEIIAMTGGDGSSVIGFESALKNVGIEYVPSYLHYAKHDANYLYQLYCECIQRYSVRTLNELCIVNLDSRRIHSAECRYVRQMHPDKMRVETKCVLFNGYKVCKACGSSQKLDFFDWNKKIQKTEPEHKHENLKILPLTETGIEKICRHFRVSYKICEDVVFIRTNYAGWIVYLSNGKVKKVLHENYRPRRSEYLKKGRMKCMEGYHKQETSSDNFYDVVEYIKQHDAGMVKRMAKKSRLENLMERVEMEMQAK